MPRRYCRGRDHSTVFFIHNDQRPSTVSYMILFSASDASRNARLRADEELRSHLAAGCYLTGRYQAPHQRSSPFFPEVHTSSRYYGTPPTSLTSVLLLQLLSHLLTALKTTDMSTCLFWMSLWPHISARPQLSDGRRGRAIRSSRAEPHLHSLDEATRRLDKQLQRCTFWLCSRSSRPRC